MTISVGALSLDVTVNVGAALSAIEKLDAAAARVGARKLDVAVSGGNSVAAATAQVTALSAAASTGGARLTASLRTTLSAVGAASRAEVAAVATAATASEAIVARSLRASLAAGNSTSMLVARLARANARPPAGPGVPSAAGTTRPSRRDDDGFLAPAAGFASSALSGLGISLGVGAAVAGVAATIGSAITAANAFNTSMRVLESTSRMAGVPLSLLQDTSKGLQRNLGLTATTANTMTAAAARFTTVAGRANETGLFMTRWLDLARSRGLSAADAMQALETTLAGDDAGLNRIGLRNPGEIYKTWGAGADTASRMQAILNEVVKEGASVAGASAAAMNTAEGAQQRLTNAKSDFLTQLGLVITGTTAYNGLLGILSGGFATATSWVGSHRSEIQVLVADLGVLASAIGTVIGKAGEFSTWITNVPYFKQLSEMSRAAMYGLAGTTKSTLDSDPTLAAAMSGPAGADPSRIAAAAAERARVAMEAASAAAEKARKKAAADARRAAAQDRRDDTAGLEARRYSALGGATGIGSVLSSIGTGPAGSDMLSQVAIERGRKAVAGAVRTILKQGESDAAKLPFTLSPKMQLKFKVAEDLRTNLAATFANLGVNIGRTFAGAIHAGFAAFGEKPVTFKTFLEAAGNSLLTGLGSIMADMGTQLLVLGGVMTGLLPSFSNPITAGPAMLIAGGILLTAGSILGAIATRNSGGGGRSGASGGGGFVEPSADVSSKVILSPRAAPVAGMQAPTGRNTVVNTPAPFIFAPTIIGQNDPRAQREIANMVYAGYRRGINQGKMR